MTVPMDSMMCLTAGHAIALAARKPIRKDPEREKACRRRGRLFTVLMVVPMGLYFLVRWPDWSWMYMFKDRSRSRSPAVAAAGLCCYPVAYELGFRNAARLIKNDRTLDALKHLGATIGLLDLLGIVAFNRLRWQGTYEEYKEGTARDALISDDFLISILVAGVIAVVSASCVVVRNRFK